MTAVNQTVAKGFYNLLGLVERVEVKFPICANTVCARGEADSSLMLRQNGNHLVLSQQFHGAHAAGANVLLSDGLENWTWLITRLAGVKMARLTQGHWGFAPCNFISWSNSDTSKEGRLWVECEGKGGPKVARMLLI